jgi:hypothetical protein
MSLDESTGSPEPSQELPPDAAYETEVFDAKVAAALRATERDVGFADFEVYRMRVLTSRSGKEVAEALGTSEATISRRLKGVRADLRTRLHEVFSKYSFTAEEWGELERNGLVLNPNKSGEAAFDEAVAEVFHRLSQREAARGDEPTSHTAR